MIDKRAPWVAVAVAWLCLDEALPVLPKAKEKAWSCAASARRRWQNTV